MVRERRNIFLRVFQRLKRPFKSFASRHSRRWNNVVRCCEEDMDDSTTNIICIPEDEKYYQYTTAVCVSGMTHDEQHHRTCNHFVTMVLASSSFEQEQIKRLYISTAKIGRSDDSSSCVHSKHQLPDSNIDSKGTVGHKLPDSTEHPAVTACRKNSVNKLSLDELEDNSDSEMAACDKSDHTSTSLDTVYCSVHSFKEVDTEEYHKTWTCQSESLTSTTTKVMETECYETSGSLSELSLSSSTLHLDASVLNLDLSEDLFYDVRSERDVDENCEKLDSLSPDDICKKIDSNHLKVYPEPFFDEVEDEVIEKSDNEHFNKELRRKNPGEMCLHDSKHQGKSSLVRKNSYRHFSQCQFNVVSIQNDIGFNCFIKSRLCLQLVPVTLRLNKHQLGICVAMHVSALQAELATRKDDLEMSRSALTVNYMEKQCLERWDSNWMRYLKHSLINEDILTEISKKDSLNKIEPERKEMINMTYEINSSPELISSLFERLQIFAVHANPGIRNMASVCSEDMHHVLINDSNDIYSILIASHENLSKSVVCHLFKKDSEKMHKKQFCFRVIVDSTIPAADSELFFLYALQFLTILCRGSAIDSALCKRHLPDFSIITHFTANLSALTPEKLRSSKVQTLKMLGAEDMYFLLSQPCIMTRLLTDHVSDSTDKMNFLLSERSFVVAEILCRNNVDAVEKTLLPSPVSRFICKEDKVIIGLETVVDIMKKEVPILFSTYHHRQDTMSFVDFVSFLNPNRVTVLADIKEQIPCIISMDHCVDFERIQHLAVQEIDEKRTLMFKDLRKKLQLQLLSDLGHYIHNKIVQELREERGCHLYYKKGRDIINQNERDCVYVINENGGIRTRDIDSCNSSKNVVCTRQYDDIFQLLTGCFNNEDLKYMRNLDRIKVGSILARVNEDKYTNIKLLIDNQVSSTYPLLYDKVLYNLCPTNRRVWFGHSRNNLGDLLPQILHYEEELSNKRLTKLLLEVERNHCDIIPLPLKFTSSDTRPHPFLLSKMKHYLFMTSGTRDLPFTSSNTQHLLFTSSETRLHPLTSSENMLHPIISSDTSSLSSSVLFASLLEALIIYDCLAKITIFTKSVQTIKIVSKKGNCEVESDSVKTNCQKNETIDCLLTSDSSLTTYNLCDQLRSDRGENQVIEDFISGGDLNDNGITYNDTGNNEKDFHGNRITKDSNTVCDNEPDLNCNGNSHHLNHTDDSRSDSYDSETTNHSNVNIDNEAQYNDMVHGHNRNDTGYNKTDFNGVGISQSPVVISNNETDIFDDSETAIESNSTEVIDVNHNARSDISDCNRPSCTKDKRYLKKLLWKFYKKNKHNEHFVGKRKVVIRKRQKHPPAIEFLVKSFFKELEKDPNLKTFDKSRKDLIYEILNQRFANDCYLYPLEQKLPVGGTLERENVRDENEIQNQNPPESVPEDVERTEESANEGLGAYFYEMQQSTRPTLEETMRFELMRLKSFWSFPRNINVSPIMLAKWGFYYTGNCAETRCFSCTASYRDWDDGDNPEQVHHRISPHCPFLTGMDARNVTSYRAGDRPSATQGSSESRSRRLVTPSTGAQSTGQGSRQNTGRSTGQSGPFDLSNFSYRAPETVAATPSSTAASTITGEPGVASANSNTKTTLSSATTVTSTGAAVSPSSTTTANSSSTASVTSSTTAQPSDAVSVATTGTTSASASVASNRITGQSGNTVATTTGDLVTPPGQARTSSSTSRANTASSQSSASSATQQRYDPLGINFDKPRYPSYAVLSNRTASFSAWPPYLRAGREMAAAGFFYAGYGDYVRCFFCGGGLRNWDAQDDPWHEHAKWFSRCAFVRMNKGEKYVNQVQKELEELERQRAQGNAASYQVDESTQGATVVPTSHSEVDSPAVRAIREMGIQEDIIQRALEIFHNRSNTENLDATVLMHIILDEIEKSPTTEEPPSASGGGRLPTESRSPVTELMSSDSAVSSNDDIIEEPGTSEWIGAKPKSKSARKRKSKQRKRKNRKEKSNEVTEPVEVTGEIDEEIETLQKENQHLREQLLCKICCEKSVSVAFLPCGHLVCCDDCAPAMRKCPMCTDYIRGTVKTFFP